MEPSAAFKKLKGHDVSVPDGRPSTPEDLLERIHDAGIVINIRATSRFTAEVLAQCPKLRLISIWGAGTDHVDLQVARQYGIRVTNTPGISAIAVAEHTLALMMAAAKQTVAIDRQVREGEWPRALATQLHGKTLGLIGAGAIGREVARLGKGIGMHVIAWTFHPLGDFLEWVSFEDVFRRSDVLSVHLRQSSDTTRLIRREHFELMKALRDFHQYRSRRNRAGSRPELTLSAHAAFPAPASMFSKRSRSRQIRRSSHYRMWCCRRTPRALLPRRPRPAWR